jgi:hypothetical protein
MKIRLFISVFLFFLFKMNQGYGATLESLNGSDSFEVFQKYMSTLSRENLNGHTFDYRFSRICDIDTDVSVSIHTTLDRINTRIKEALSFTGLHFVFSENYITDTGFKTLCDFLLNNSILSNQIIDIDLSNNRITKNSVSEIEKLLAAFPHLQLDLSINYLAKGDLIGLSSSIKERITYNSY